MARLNNLIDGIWQAGRQTAESWLGAPTRDADLRESRVSAMVACLAWAILAPLLSVFALLPAFSWPLTIAGALAVSALPVAAAGILSATGSPRVTGYAAIAMAAAALAALAVASGGLASPFLPLLTLIPLEASFQSRKPAGFAAGLGAGLAALAVAAVTGAAGLTGPAPQAGIVATLLPLGLYALARGAALCFEPEASEPPAAAEPAIVRPGSDFSAFDQLPGLVTRHDAHGEVIDVAGLDCAALSARIGNVLGKGFVNRIHVADRIAFLDAFDVLRRGDARAEVELRFETADTAGQFLHVAISLSANHGPDGAFEGVVAQTRDISTEIAARQRADAVIEEAKSANAAKTRFLAAVSHELRTPLNAIIGFSDILAREFFGKFADERQREYAGLIHQSGEHLLSVVNTMLDMSKIEVGRYEVFVEPFALGEVVESCDAMLRLQAGKRGVTLTRRISRDVGEVIADRRAMHQILINLVGNAIKFTDKGGVVNVDATIRDGWLRLIVSDTGIGIPADKLACIGEPFMQAQNGLSRHYEGSGLGLSLVKGLVDLHGGGFIIDSVEGEGTVVTIDLPADGSGANRTQSATAEPVAFPPLLPSANKATVKTDDKTRNEDHAETARSA